MSGDFDSKLHLCLATARKWENPESKRKALSLIPLEDLEAIAQAKFDSSGGDSQQTSFIESVAVVRDLLLLELLNWFKNDFFTWTNSPSCTRCGGSTKFTASAPPDPLELVKGADRVELHKCEKPQCAETVRFPRYNDPAVLLDTKTGRCGEWANCFGLVCRAAGFETRYVYDFTDHVWIEVFSSGMKPQNRWLHCDPCENTCDNPLLYEAGWGKKLTFVLGASVDDIQDVTWRYTQSKSLKQVLERRNCNERHIAETVARLRKELQAALPPNRKKLLDARLVQETVEFLSPRTNDIKLSELQGRESGSLAWRLARQEIGAPSSSSTTESAGHEWEVQSQEGRDYELTYDPVLDSYRNSADSNLLRGWKNGTFTSENILRKEERDWKMVYLARQENSNADGKITWKFVLPSSSTSSVISRISLEMLTKTFHESAKIRWQIVNEQQNATLIPDSFCKDGMWRWESDLSCRSVTIICELLGGSGDVAWQHAQLFRTSTQNRAINSVSIIPPFRVIIKVQQ